MTHSRTKELEAIVVLAFVMLSFYLLFKKDIFVYVSFALMFTSLLSKPLTSQIVSAWFRFAELLGNFNAKIILSVVFFAFLTPLAFSYKLFVKNPLGLKKSMGESYFVNRNHKYKSADLKNTW